MTFKIADNCPKIAIGFKKVRAIVMPNGEGKGFRRIISRLSAFLISLQPA